MTNEGDAGTCWAIWPENAGDDGVIFRDRLECVILIAKIIEIGIGEVRIGAAVVDLPNGYEAIRVGVRQGTKEYAVDYAENGGGGSDAQCEGEDHQGAESRTLGETASGIFQILESCLEHGVSSVLRRALFFCAIT